MGRPKSKQGKTESVKLDMDVIESARVISAITGEPLIDLLSGILRPILQEREREALQGRMGAIGPKRKPKGGD